MPQQIMPNLYKVKVPIPNNPLKEVNAYVIKSPQRNLVIDPGMNRKDCVEKTLAALNELNVEIDKTDFFLTHMHADHSGMVAAISGTNSKVYCSQADAPEIVPNDDYWNVMAKGAITHGFPKQEVDQALSNHPGYRFSNQIPLEFTFLHDDDVLSIGDYQFRCVETPGHTKGHLCLYEPNKRLLISGDHVLGDITPNIFSYKSTDGNPLDKYLHSLDKISQLDVELVLPGHRNFILNFRERINELHQHYLNRASEVLSILESGSMDGYTTASHMTWDIISPSWDEFPVAQKWFATGEAVAHLKYLEAKKNVKREIFNAINVFSLA